jgi:hypothetical protein
MARCIKRDSPVFFTRWRQLSYAASVAGSMGSKIERSSFSGLLTRVEIAHIRSSSAGKGRIRSRGSGSSPSQRT